MLTQFFGYLEEEQQELHILDPRSKDYISVFLFFCVFVFLCFCVFVFVSTVRPLLPSLSVKLERIK